MWIVAVYVLTGVLAAVSIWLLVRLRDEVSGRISLEENAEYIRDLQARAIDQLRQEVVVLQNRILEMQHQEPPSTACESTELPEAPDDVFPRNNPDCPIPDIKGKPIAIAPC